MHFSIIYTADVPVDCSIAPYVPKPRSVWVQTERDDGAPNEWNGEWRCKHRKWAGVLNRAQFDALIDQTGMHAENVETMGSLGAPGCGLGIAPAISFWTHHEVSTDTEGYVILSAYVTPVPTSWVEGRRQERDEETSDRLWRRIREAVLACYGDN